MITIQAIQTLLEGVRGQALREGTRYANQGRVGSFVGTAHGLETTVEGKRKEFEVALWTEDGRVAHRCTCPSWRDPCKHEVAAALALKAALVREAGEEQPPLPPEPDPEATRRLALAERVEAGRREHLAVRRGEGPEILVTSVSGFVYRVRVRGGPAGPHGCDCPDFETNRLHTCKHVERVRRVLPGMLRRLSPAARRAMRAPHVYLWFGEVVEPRLFGEPTGRGARRVRGEFDADGVALHPRWRDEDEMLRWLGRLGGAVDPRATAWLRRRTERRPRLPKGDLLRGALPRGLSLYPYQRDGALFLARAGRALLADEMGLGKTVQAIVAARILGRAERPVRRVTVVCPASLRAGWQEEIRRWAGAEAVLVEGPTAQRAATIASRPAWLVTHYEQLLRDHPRHREHAPDLLIVDEAQRTKGLGTRTARLLKSIDTPHLFALTGTPLENRLEEAYAIAQLVDQRLLPPLWQVDRDHFVREAGSRAVTRYRGLGALRARLAPAFLRRTKAEVCLELPERVRSLSMVEMHPAVRGTHEEVLDRARQILARKVILPADLERVQRLLLVARRCCDGPHLVRFEDQSYAPDEAPKMKELEQALRELCLDEGRKAVVFSEWTDMTRGVESLCRRLSLPCLHLHGGVPVRRRPLLIRSFREQEGPAVFVSTDAGGVGLNLQVADVVVNLDLPWNPARLEQRIARVHRIGSKDTVRILLFVSKGGIEERILHLHDTKRNVLENVWAAAGDDTIAAPGGSGTLRNVAEAVLSVGAPPAPPRTRARQAAAGRFRPAAPDPTATPATGARVEVAPATPPPAAAPAPFDPSLLERVVAALTPALPAGQSEPLVAALRALADALSGAGAQAATTR